MSSGAVSQSQQGTTSNLIRFHIPVTSLSRERGLCISGRTLDSHHVWEGSAGEEGQEWGKKRAPCPRPFCHFPVPPPYPFLSGDIADSDLFPAIGQDSSVSGSWEGTKGSWENPQPTAMEEKEGSRESIPKQGSGNMSKHRSRSLFSKSGVVVAILLLEQTSLCRMKGWICMSFINNHELECRSI